MPLECSVPIHAVSEDDFHAIDHRMLGLAFGIHNEFGRLMHEETYKTELTHRCAQAGMTVRREVPVRAVHRSFAKDYFIDLLLEDSVVVELKTVTALTEAHRGQTLNYLFLTGTRHASLVNFRRERVQREFVSTTLRIEDRRSFRMESLHWPSDALHDSIRAAIHSVAADFGLGLDTGLYRDALAHLLTGQPSAKSLVPVYCDGRRSGHQEMTLVSPDVALAVTAFDATSHYQPHLERLIRHTRLASIAWINLSFGCITLHSIAGTDRMM
jgi:GxxExxY protein